MRSKSLPTTTSPAPPAVRFAWGPAPPLLTDAEAERVRSADAVVVCAGFSLMLESEGVRPDLRASQRPARADPQGRRAQPEDDRRPQLRGRRGHRRLARPGAGARPGLVPGTGGRPRRGRGHHGQPSTRAGSCRSRYGKRREDSASFGNYPGSNGRVDYAEGILVGYRWFDAKGVAPLFPFGFGLSYTTFHYDKLHVEPAPDGRWRSPLRSRTTGRVPATRSRRST